MPTHTGQFDTFTNPLPALMAKILVSTIWGQPVNGVIANKCPLNFVIKLNAYLSNLANQCDSE